MELYKGEIVSLSHYSGVVAFKSTVIEVKDNDIHLKLTKEFAKSNFFEGDPIVLVREQDNIRYICECTIDEICVEESTIILKIDNAQSMANHRIFERFPVSLYAGIKAAKMKKKGTAIVKNISVSGMSLSSKADFKKGEIFDLDIYMDEKIIPVQVEIAWKKKGQYKYEYGARILYEEFNTKNTIKLYLEILRNEQEKFIKEIKI